MAFYVDNEKIGGVLQLCKRLKINENDIPYKKRTKEFEQASQRDANGNPKRDRDGNYITKRKIAGVPAFTVFVQGEAEVTVRLAQTQRKDAKDEFVYTPKLITMEPGEDGSVSFNDEIEFVFWFLHPWNLQSPFHVKGAPHFYEYKDTDMRSKKENEWEEARIDALGTIVGRNALSIARLRTLAKGLNIDGVNDMTDDVVRKKLRDEASKNPIDFINKVDSREVIFSGKIQDAIDRGLIKLENLNGMNRWYLNGKEIIPVAYGADAMAVLNDELSSKWYLYAKDIEDSLSGVTVTSNLSNPANDEYFNAEPSHKVEQLAEVTPEQRVYLKKMQDEEWFDTKIKKLAKVDPNDVTVHWATLKSYNENIDAVEAYRASLKPDPELV